MKDVLKNEILALFDLNENYTVPEIMIGLEKKGYTVKGERSLNAAENCFFWIDTASDFNQAMAELMNNNQLQVSILSQQDAFLVHSYSGNVLDMPYTNKQIAYKKPHWLPIVLRRS